MNAESFGYKNAWIAAKDVRPEAVAHALSLRNVRAADWEDRGEKVDEAFPGCAVDQSAAFSPVRKGEFVDDQHHFADHHRPHERSAEAGPGDAVLAQNQLLGDQDEGEGDEEKNRRRKELKITVLDRL